MQRSDPVIFSTRNRIESAKRGNVGRSAPQVDAFREAANSVALVCHGFHAQAVWHTCGKPEGSETVSSWSLASAFNNSSDLQKRRLRGSSDESAEPRKRTDR